MADLSAHRAGVFVLPVCAVLLPAVRLASLPGVPVGGEGAMLTFSSPMAALAWFVRERQRADGLRAQPYDPRAIGPINGPMTQREDRLLLLAVIGCCMRRVPKGPRRALFLASVGDLDQVSIARELRCSDRWARHLIAEGREALGATLRRVGIVH